MAIIRAIIQTTLGIIAALFILMVAIVVGPKLVRAWNAQDFEQTAWMASVDREKMSSNVIEWLTTEKPTKEEVLQRLGPPSGEFEVASGGSGNLSYTLTRDEDIVIDGYSLEIWFESGRVSDARRMQN